MRETYSDDGTAEELAESDAENNELIDGEWNATDKAYRPLVKELTSLRQQLAEAQRENADKALEIDRLERELAEAKKDAERIRAFIVQIGIVGQIDGHDVIRRESAIELIDRVIAMREGE